MHQMLKNTVHILGDNYNFSTKEIIGWAYEGMPNKNI